MVSLHLDYTKYTLKSQVKTLCIFHYIIRILCSKTNFYILWRNQKILDFIQKKTTILVKEIGYSGYNLICFYGEDTNGKPPFPIDIRNLPNKWEVGFLFTGYKNSVFQSFFYFNNIRKYYLRIVVFSYL